MSTVSRTSTASVAPSPTGSITRTTSLSPSAVVAAAASSTSDDITLPIIYAVIGVTAGLVILICLVYCIVRWRASKNKPPPAKQPAAAAAPPPPAVAAAHVQVNIDGDPSSAQQKRGSSASQRLPRPSAAGLPPVPPRASIAATPDRGRVSLGASPHTPVESSPLRTLLRPQSAAAMSPREAQFGGGSPPMLRTHSAGSMRATSPLPPGSTGGDPLAASPLRQQQQQAQGALSASPSQRGFADSVRGVSPAGSAQRMPTTPTPTGAAAATRSPLLGLTPLSAGSGGAGHQLQLQQQQGTSPLSARYAAQTLGRRRLQAQTAASPRRDSPLIDEEPPSHPALHHKLSDGMLLPLQGQAFVYPPPPAGGYGASSPPGPGPASARSPASAARSPAGGAAAATTPVAAGPVPHSSVAFLRGHLDLDDSPGSLAATWRKHQSL